MENSKSQHRYYNLLLLTYLIFSTLFSITLFLSSFFPITYHSNATASFDHIPTTINGVNLNTTTLYKPSVHKVVFMVIDSLRWDFINDTHRRSMPSTSGAIETNTACLIQAKANAPTVTMPRIKAMMTGMVSNFIDVALNLGETSVSSDSILKQAALHGHKIIFYGDDTWIKLFPGMFHRQEGTTSFYVPDFTEVDQNVTRNIHGELEDNEDWSIMILHYLGLDHIGHLQGPMSPLVGPKLKEMDDVIGTILDKIERWKISGTDALLIVSGDHGMKNSGGHGGATEEETLVPFLVFGRSCSSEVSQIEQVDIATTLAMLLGIPIPHSNLGSVAMEMIKNQPEASQLFLLHYNAKQVFEHFRKLSDFESSEIYDNYYKAIKLHTEWLIGKNKPGHEDQFDHIVNLYDKTLKGMKEILVNSAVKYDRTTMTFAIVLLLQIFVILFSKNWGELFSGKLFVYWWFLGISLWLILNHFLYNESNEVYFEITDFFIMTVALGFYTMNCWICTKSSDVIFSEFDLELTQIAFPAAMVLHVVSFTSSSFVEEEHQTWYFFWTTFLVIMLYCKAGKIHSQKKLKEIFVDIGKIFGLLLQHRILRKWHSTGNKYAQMPDISGWLKSHESALSLTVLVSLASLVLIGLICEDERRRRRTSLVFHLILASCVYVRHTSENSLVIFDSLRSTSKGISEVRFFWIFLGLFLVYNTVRNYWIYKSDRNKFLRRIIYDVIRIWVAISVLLHRPHNIILVPMELMTMFWIYDLGKKTNNNLVYVAYWIGNVFYFYQGNSNSLATVDVTAGYVGLQAYWPTLGTIYVCINTYSAPILAYLMIVYRITCDNQGYYDRTNIFSINRDFGIIRVFPLAVYTVIVTVQRYHLFIWTVFAPKLLYEAMYTAVLFVTMFIVQIPFVLNGK